MTFVDAVRVVCTRHKGSVTSWWRSVRHNAFVGGVPNSRHLMGEAVDVVYDGNVLPPIAELEGLNLRVVREKDHDHLEPRL